MHERPSFVRSSPRHMAHRLLLLLPLLGCARAPEQAGPPSTALPPGQLRPQQLLTFEEAPADAPWTRFRTDRDARSGTHALAIGASDEYVPLAAVRAGDVGVDVIAVRLSAWIKVRTAGRLRTILQATGPDGRSAKRFSRIVRAEELTPGTWMELHTQMDLLAPATPDTRLTVSLWNEGGAAMSVDDAAITFVSADVPGSPPGRPFDVDSLIEGRMPDGRIPSIGASGTRVDTLEHP